MLKLKTLIVEDQIGPLKRLLKFLQNYPDVFDFDTMQIAKSFSEAQNIILNGRKFDLSILDRNLGGGKTCFNLITKENKEAFGVIALNTKDESAQRYFEEISPLGEYLVLRKPYNEDDVAAFVERLLNVKRSAGVVILGDSNPLLLKDRNKTFPIEQGKIVYIEVSDNYCYIFYEKNGVCNKNITSKQLKHYESVLSNKMFYRISDKHLLNRSFFQELSEGRIKLNIKFDGKEIFLPLPEKNRSAFLSHYTK